MVKFRIGNILVTDGKFGSVFVIRPSLMTPGKTNTMAMHGPRASEIAAWLTARSRGTRQSLIQDAFPTLSAEEREFILTGYTPTEWDRLFPKGEEHDR